MVPREITELLKPFPRPAPSPDPLDVLTGDVTGFSPDDIAGADHVIVGCPQDLGVRRNHGRPGAAQGPTEIRRWLYKLKPPAVNPAQRICDLGDVLATGELEEIHVRLESVVRFVLAAGKKAVILGGGNDISLPDFKAASSVHPDCAALNLDAHLDMRVADRVHSGTPYRDLIDCGALAPHKLHQIGIQPWANSPRYLALAAEAGVAAHPLDAVRQAGALNFIRALLRRLPDTPLFLGLDLDSIRAADAPGVSAPSPLGFTAGEIIDLVLACREHGRTALLEISELNPGFDPDGRTARLAALAVYGFVFGRRGGTL